MVPVDWRVFEPVGVDFSFSGNRVFFERAVMIDGNWTRKRVALRGRRVSSDPEKRLWIPIRELCDSILLGIFWDSENQILYLKRIDNTKIKNHPRVFIDRKEIVFSVSPVMKNGSVFVPVDSVLLSVFGASAKIEKKNRFHSVRLTIGEITNVFNEGMAEYQKGNEEVVLKLPVFLKHGVFMIPVQSLAVKEGDTIFWSKDSYAVFLARGFRDIPPAVKTESFKEPVERVEHMVPQVHASYGILAGFAERGFISSETPFRLRSGKILTRDQITALIIEVLNVFDEHPELFSSGELKSMEFLIKEFKYELEKSGVSYFKIFIDIAIAEVKKGPPSPAPPVEEEIQGTETVNSGKVKKPPADTDLKYDDSRIYDTFLYFAEKGFIENYPPYLFRGERVFSKDEFALVLADLLDQVRDDRDRFSQTDLDKIFALTDVFYQELASIGYEYNDLLSFISAGARGTDFSLKARVNPALTLKESENSKFTTRVDLETSLGGLKYLLRGKIDKDDGYKYDLSEWSINYKQKVFNGSLPLDMMAGDSVNIDFGTGFVAGNARVKGYKVNIANIERAFTDGGAQVAGGEESTDNDAHKGQYNAFAFYGEKNDGIKFSGLRVEHEIKDRLSFGTSIAKTYNAGTDNALQKGVDFKLKTNKNKTEAEYSEKSLGGNGLYLSSIHTVNESFSVNFEYRDYNRIETEFGSVPTYSGSSGGDANDEKGYLIATNWKISDKLNVYASRDTYNTQAGTSQRLAYYSRARIVLSDKKQMTLSYKSENAPDQNPITRSMGYIHQLPGNRMFQMNYSYDTGADRKTRTIRTQFRFPLFNERVKVTLNDTYRDSNDEDENTVQIQFVWKISPHANIASSFSLSESNNNDLSFSISMPLKYEYKSDQ